MIGGSKGCEELSVTEPLEKGRILATVRTPSLAFSSSYTPLVISNSALIIIDCCRAYPLSTVLSISPGKYRCGDCEAAKVAMAVDPFTIYGKAGKATPAIALEVKGPVWFDQYSSQASDAKVLLFVSSVGLGYELL